LINRVKQFQKKNQEGGVSMKTSKVVWSTIDASHRYHPLFIIEFAYREDYEEFLRLRFDVKKAVFLTKQLQGGKIVISTEQGDYELEFPSYFSEKKGVALFWFGNAFETYEEAFKRMTREIAKEFYHKLVEEREGENLWIDLDEANREIFDKWQEAQKRAQQILDSLPIIRVYGVKPCQ
jgi:hypothetical protein